MPIERNLVSTTQPHLNDPPSDGKGATITIDVESLVLTRMLVQANSGGGKSRTIRRILEQTHGHVQQLVIDPDGEYHTLREQYEYVHAAPTGGDCVASVEAAALLARRLLELGVSAIIDICDLGKARVEFVKRFVESLMTAPRDLWHPVLIAIDEAHRFAPQDEPVASSNAVVSLMSEGRKRGFGTILATQRLSKLDKDAAAEANNLVIGRTSLDLDIRRAASVLGLPKSLANRLSDLQPGEFFVTGPALCPSVERIRIGHVKTTHPRAGGAVLPTPTPARVRAVLEKLKDLPAQAAEAASTEDKLRAEIAVLKGKLKEQIAPMGGVQRESEWAIELDNARASLAEEQARTAFYKGALSKVDGDKVRALEAEVKMMGNLLDDIANTLDTFSGQIVDLRNQIPDTLIDHAEREAPRLSDDDLSKMATSMDPASRLIAAGAMGQRAPKTGNPHLSKMQRTFLSVLAVRGTWLGDRYQAFKRDKVLLWSNYARSGATNKAFGALHDAGYIANHGDGSISITSSGVEALGEADKIPQGRELRAAIKRDLPAMERTFFEALEAVYPHAVGRAEILKRTGYARSGSTNKAFGRLTGRDYVRVQGKGSLVMAEELFT